MVPAVTYGRRVTTTKNRFLYVAAAAALSLTLASCAGDGDGEETGAPEGDGTTTEQTDDGADDTEGDEGTTEDDGGDVAAGGAECLVGTWAMTPEAMEEQVLAQMGGEGEVSVEGTTEMTFDGTTVTSEANNSASYSTEVEGTAIEGSTETDGVFVVNYTADDTTLTYGDVESAEGTVTVTVAGTSQEQDFADSANLLPGQEVEYTCSDSELSLTMTSDVNGETFTVTQVFTRA